MRADAPRRERDVRGASRGSRVLRGAPRLAAVTRDATDALEPVPKAARAASVLALAVIVAVAAWVCSEALATIRVDMTSMHARREAAFWLTDPKRATTPAWERAMGEAREALQMAPANPMLHDLVSTLYLVRSESLPMEETTQRRELLEQALSYQQKSLALLPQNADGWADAAALRQMLEHDSAAVASDWNQALAYGPHEGVVQQRLTVIALSMWQEAPEAMKGWVMKRYERGSAADRAELKALAEAFEVRLDAADAVQ